MEKKIMEGSAKFAELQEGILEVLRYWNQSFGSNFDAMWYGYEALQDELIALNIVEPISKIKKAMKELKKLGRVDLEPTYDDEFNLSGSGYFLSNRHIPKLNVPNK